MIWTLGAAIQPEPSFLLQSRAEDSASVGVLASVRPMFVSLLRKLFQSLETSSN